MKTINYQGQEIAVELVNEHSGDVPVVPGKYHQGDEEIFRDDAGQYYLRRRLARLDLFTPKERRACVGALTHRISMTAAALWAVARTNPQSRVLRADLAYLLTGGNDPGLGDLDEDASAYLREYVTSRGVDARDALNGAVYMALSTSGLADDEAVAVAKENRLEAEDGDEDPEGCIVRFLSPNGRDDWEVPFSAEVTAAIEERAQEDGCTFAEAVIAMIERSVSKRRANDVPGGVVTMSVTVLRGDYEAASRYAAEHGRTVQESLALLVKEFAKQAPVEDRLLNKAADRSGLALCAAAMPSLEDEEGDEPEPPKAA